MALYEKVRIRLREWRPQEVVSGLLCNSVQSYGGDLRNKTLWCRENGVAAKRKEP